MTILEIHFGQIKMKFKIQAISWRREVKKSKVVPLHAMEVLGGRGDIAPTHSKPRH
jgi:hypothetical protein